MTLTQVITLILMKPDYMLGKKKQTYSQNYRISQTQVTYMYHLVFSIS